jgi:non-lysosomal glucosylceramidase
VKITRRQLIAAVPALAAAVAVPLPRKSGTGSRARSRRGDDNSTPAEQGVPSSGNASSWSVPDAAFKRPVGSHPLGATGATLSIGTDGLPLSRTKRGIPVGGIGTGSFMYNLCGSFGPWHLDIGGDDSIGSRWGSARNSGFEQRFLPGAAFHVRLASSAKTAVTTLATEDTLPAWTGLQPGQGTYSALFPKAWFEFTGLDVPVTLKQLTPYVAGDERHSSLPAGIFEIAVENPTGESIDAACMFSFPNAVYRLPTTQYTYTRTGLSSSIVRDSDCVGVRLQAESPLNVAVTDRTEWVIAAKGPSGCELSATADWDAGGDGSDLIVELAGSGRLPDAPLDVATRALGGAVCVSFSLAPGERKTATFVLAWDFPVVQFKNPVDGTSWWKRYTEWYPGHYRGWDIAKYVVENAAQIEQSIDSWWTKVANEPSYPQWLRCAALNELYYDVFGAVFWENGCISKPKVFGNRPGQHLYFTLEDDAFRDCESFDVRHYEARHMLQLFPSIEHDLLLGWADMIRWEPDHLTPHDAGSPVDDPWFVVGQYAATEPGRPPLNVDWLDTPAKFVQQAHAYWTYTGDDQFGSEVYQAAQLTMNHLLSRDYDADGIPDANGRCTTYDDIPMFGATTYVASLTVGACEAMADFATTFDTSEAVKYWGAAASNARGSAESLLWSEGGYYRLDDEGPYGEMLMADALCGQRYAAVNGLTDVLDVDRMTRHLSLVYSQNVEAVGSARFGAVNAVDPQGRILGTSQAQAVWPGGSYFVAALMYSLGRATGQNDLMEAALNTAYGVYRTTYLDEGTAFWFDTPAQWFPTVAPFQYRSPQYQRCRAAWEMLVAVHDPFPPGWSSS